METEKFVINESGEMVPARNYHPAFIPHHGVSPEDAVHDEHRSVSEWGVSGWGTSYDERQQDRLMQPLHVYELGVFESKQLLEKFRTDVDIGIAMITSEAQRYALKRMESNPEQRLQLRWISHPSLAGKEILP